ncbi:pickpocket protein 11-like [Leptopilina boulardi]|uniref:pickpocket protein 11-like n=1 Tax=Leptopilina boulardi TaxID=63433 RepID=UPI0021F622B9|nr:pickpocket protein 11-like [Leptopilina boulardi]
MKNLQNQKTVKNNSSQTGDIIRLSSRKRKCSGKKILGPNFQNFCEHTSLHGFHYITSPNTSVVERIIWSLICTIFLLIAFGMMFIIMYHYSKTPTTTTIETTAYPIWDIEFPAITICNHNKVYLPSALNVTKTLLKKNIGQEEIDSFFKLLPQLIRPSFQRENFKNMSSILERINKTMEQLMFELMQPCSKMLRLCVWLDQEYDCNKIFKATKSSEGFCCSFNYHVRHNKKLNVDNTTKEDWNYNKIKDEGQPGVDEIQFVPGAGRDYGLIVHFDLESEYYIGSIKPYIGASILIHHPNEFPEVDLRSIIIQPSQEVTVLLSGTIIESEPGIRDLPLNLRNCLFKDEKKLNISTTYGYQSCVSQCRIKFIVTHCKCIPFYYPKIYPDVRICNLRDIECLQSIRKNISELQTDSDVNAYDVSSSEEEEEEQEEQEDNDDEKQPKKTNCSCFPLCTDNWYTLNTESAYMESFHNNIMLLNGLDINKTSTAVIYFRDITCIKYKRDKWKSLNDLIASLGGILGLCVGGSFVSVFEVIYFFIINKCFKKKSKTSTPKIVMCTNISSNVDNTKKSENQSNAIMVENKISPMKLIKD